MVDDDPAIRGLVASVLELTRWPCTRASDARTAVERFVSDPCDVVLLDLMLPDRSGMDVLRELRGPEAVAELAYRMLDQLRRALGHGPARISTEALERLTRHAWPGNLREFRHVLDRALVSGLDSPELLPRLLPRDLASAPAPPAGGSPVRDLATHLAAEERRQIALVLAEMNGNRAATARELGISRATLYEKLRRHRLEPG